MRWTWETESTHHRVSTRLANIPASWINIRCHARAATISEWPPKWFLKMSAADRPLRCMVLFGLFFFVLVLVLVLEFGNG